MPYLTAASFQTQIQLNPTEAKEKIIFSLNPEKIARRPTEKQLTNHETMFPPGGF